MLKPLTLAAVLLAAAAPMAHAQDSYDDGNDRYERSDSDDGPRGDAPERRDEPGINDMRHGDRWARERDDDREMGKRDRVKDGGREARRDGDRGPRFGPRGPHGPGDRRGPPPPPPPRAGFEIRLGMGQAIRVDCGDEAIAQCVDAAQPILDAMEGAFKPRPGPGGGPEADRVPPPPANLVEPDAGDAPDAPNAPTPPAGTAPAN